MKSIRCSQIKSYEICPSYEPSKGTSDAAEEGTKLHKAWETGSIEDLDFEQAIAVQSCSNFESKRVSGGAKCFKEFKIAVPVEGIAPGTIDRFYLLPGGRAVLFDAKFGQGEVEDAETNWQMIAYTLGLFHMMPQLNWVEAYLILPRQNEVSEGKFHRSEMPRLVKALEKIVERANDSFESFCARPDNCRFCAAIRDCPAITQSLCKVVRNIEGLTVPNFSVALTPESRAQLQDLVAPLEAWIKSMKADNNRVALEDGVEIPGYYIKESRSGVELNDILGVWDIVQTELKMPLPVFLQACKVSITGLEGQVRALTEKGGKDKAVQKTRELLSLKGLLNEGTPIFYLAKKRGKKKNEDSTQSRIGQGLG